MKGFQTEYGKFPLEAIATADEHILQRTRGAILLVLLGKDSKINPREVVFIDLPEAKNKKRGLYHDEHTKEPILVDQWGEPFYFVLDLNKDGKVPNPDSRPDQPRELATEIIVFSAGPDRDPKTWNDNITNW